MTRWYDKVPGSPVMVSRDDDREALISLDPPDWVRLPEDLGGQVRAVLAVALRRCVAAGHEHEAVHYALRGGVHCCECCVDGRFYWYTRKGEALRDAT